MRRYCTPMRRISTLSVYRPITFSGANIAKPAQISPEIIMKLSVMP